jgi:hypothetical protein
MEGARKAYMDLMTVTVDIMRLATDCHHTLKQVKDQADNLQKLGSLSPGAHRIMSNTIAKQQSSIQEKFLWVTTKYPALNPNKPKSPPPTNTVRS